MPLALTPRPCPVCQSLAASRPFAESNVDLERLDRFAFASRKLPEYMHWRLAECLACDLLYADPAPSADDLAGLYRQAAFASAGEARLASRTYAAFLPAIAARLPDRDGALDVGTGDGAFLGELLAAGFRSVAGVEPSEAPVAAADPRVRPLIHNEVFRAGMFGGESLSLVSCFQTIEHLHEPAQFCRDVFRLLKPGGALFLVSHNRRAVSARVLGRRSPIFDLEHLQLFSPRSLHRLLRSAGYGHVETRPILNRYPLHYWLKLFPFPSRWKSPMRSRLARSPLGSVVLPLPAGNLATIAYKPVVPA